ncbi:pyroglutamyl peptidase [Wenjunlia tyrosinilytica]|uniref:Pyroglutamyl peptidase n=1 Tax=Wenjunlia tyrosinilytica TaxID=1544741 RepID=A0A917ZCM4_9ACTN|nr:pyroglutamyl peptidase [Wenjunlia tyrosinilytica]GGO80401.1 hypothetical protein GCM10012280_02230 [Wenjunlia tyrosinilytica]
MSKFLVRLCAAVVSLVACAPSQLQGAASAADRERTACADPAAAVTVEEQRLDRPVPQEILRRSGFDAAVARFGQDLCRAGSLTAARSVVDVRGRQLWRSAVDRVQGRGPAQGDLRRDDDRPLYWARLAMARALRQWQPSFSLEDARREELIGRLERTSRGQDAISFGCGDRVKRILVTGFDPFTLDRDIRISNPSGASALALDGVTVETASGPARIETVVFPVRWRDFAEGTVERTLLPYFRPGPRRVDMFTTVSQGRPGRFDVERWNGAWRGGFGDNENASSTGVVPIPEDVPAQHPQPQWTVTTLPYKALVDAGTGRFPVRDNTSVTEIPAGQSTPVVRDDGPTEGSAARAGGGGDYLSNEIAYRATALRDAVGLKVPGGHVHTPVLTFGAGNPDQVTDPEFVRNRLDIVAQVRAILTTAAGTLDG